MDGHRICCSAREHFRNGVPSSYLPPLLWILVCGYRWYCWVILAVVDGGTAWAKLCHLSDVLYLESTSWAQLWKRLGRDFDDDVFMVRAVAWL